jgi:anti-sigma factor RsiW
MESCKDIQTQLADFAVGALPQPERVEIQRHLQKCEACQRELRALQRVGTVLDALPPEEATEGLWSAIRREIEAPKPEPEGVAWWEMLFPARWPRLVYAALAATAVAMVALIVTLSQPLPTEDDEAQDFLLRHGMLAWNDPLSDKAALGVMLGRNEREQGIQ